MIQAKRYLGTAMHTPYTMPLTRTFAYDDDIPYKMMQYFYR